MAHDIFVSYSSFDKPIADAICFKLENERIRCWIAPRDVMPGVSYPEALIDAINNSKLLVLVFSSNANNSKQVVREVERAVSKGIPILPVRIEDVVPTKQMEYLISSVHWLDAMTPPIERHLESLVETAKLFLKHGDGFRLPGSEGNKYKTEKRAKAQARKTILLLAVALASLCALVFGIFNSLLDQNIKKFSGQRPALKTLELSEGLTFVKVYNQGNDGISADLLTIDGKIKEYIRVSEPQRKDPHEFAFNIDKKGRYALDIKGARWTVTVEQPKVSDALTFPIVFKGEDSRRLSPYFYIDKLPITIETIYKGDSNMVAQLHRVDGKVRRELIINDIDPFENAKTYTLDPGIYLIDVQSAKGEWTINIKPKEEINYLDYVTEASTENSQFLSKLNIIDRSSKFHQRFAGIGKALEKVELKKGIAIFTLSNKGGSGYYDDRTSSSMYTLPRALSLRTKYYFEAELNDIEGKTVKKLGMFWNSEEQKISVLHFIDKAQVYLVDVKGGDWEIMVDQLSPASSLTPPLMFSGMGDKGISSFFKVNKSPVHIAVAYEGESYVSAKLISANGEYHTICSGTGSLFISKYYKVESGFFLIYMENAPGRWKVSVK